jgi:hypothetical protein
MGSGIGQALRTGLRHIHTISLGQLTHATLLLLRLNKHTMHIYLGFALVKSLCAPGERGIQI